MELIEMTFALVFVAWMFSLCLHEFSHAMAAYWGGDLSVKDKGYLSLNPIKYAHPVYSLALPMLFLLMGGLGLPGGAVYIDHSRLRSKAWQSAVSLAGPLADAFLAVVIGLLLQFEPISAGPCGPAIAFLGVLEVCPVVLNLLPIPPFDGFGAIEPFLPEDVALSAQRLGNHGVFLVMLVLWNIPAANASLWNATYALSRTIGIPVDQASAGFHMFMFWTR
jgi:Zn-dependent protease